MVKRQESADTFGQLYILFFMDPLSRKKALPSQQTKSSHHVPQRTLPSWVRTPHVYAHICMYSHQYRRRSYSAAVPIETFSILKCMFLSQLFCCGIWQVVQFLWLSFPLFRDSSAQLCSKEVLPSTICRTCQTVTCRAVRVPRYQAVYYQAQIWSRKQIKRHSRLFYLMSVSMPLPPCVLTK